MSTEGRYSLDFENKISEQLEQAGDKAVAVCTMYATTKAPSYRARLQAERKWRDRTGAAKQRLNVQASSNGNIITLTFSHGVDYGVWLELAHEKRYAVLMPTILKLSPEYMDGITDIFNSLFA